MPTENQMGLNHTAKTCEFQMGIVFADVTHRQAGGLGRGGRVGGTWQNWGVGGQRQRCQLAPAADTVLRPPSSHCYGRCTG